MIYRVLGFIIFAVFTLWVWYRIMRINSQNERHLRPTRKPETDSMQGLRRLAQKLHDKKLLKISRKQVLKLK